MTKAKSNSRSQIRRRERREELRMSILTLPIRNRTQVSNRSQQPVTNDPTITSKVRNDAQVPDCDVLSAQVADLGAISRPNPSLNQLVYGGLYPTQKHAFVATTRQELARLEKEGDQEYLAKYRRLPHRELDDVNIIVHLEVHLTNGTTVSTDSNAPVCGIRLAAEACPTLQLLCDQAFPYYPPLFKLYQTKSWSQAKEIVRWKIDDEFGWMAANDEMYKQAFDQGVRRSRAKNVDIWISALTSI